MIHTRHVRHDWRTWGINKNQAHVKTLCGKTTKEHLSGIPGVTYQDLRVRTRTGGISWGWCVPCCFEMQRQLFQLPSVLPTSEFVVKQYNAALKLVSFVVVNNGGADSGDPFLSKEQERDLGMKWRWQNHPSNFVCYLCKKPNTDVVDHIFPRSLGGPDVWWNKAKVHTSCNRAKGNMLPEEIFDIFPQSTIPEYFQNKSI